MPNKATIALSLAIILLILTGCTTLKAGYTKPDGSRVEVTYCYVMQNKSVTVNLGPGLPAVTLTTNAKPATDAADSGRKLLEDLGAIYLGKQLPSPKEEVK